jgi:WD40 repeat-containing protein SMU1
MSLEIESQDVIRLVLQFLKETNLMDSMKILQKESGITLNTVDNIENFVSDIRNGRWDSVLSQVSHLQLPSDKLVSFFIFYIITVILKLFIDN